MLQTSKAFFRGLWPDQKERRRLGRMIYRAFYRNEAPRAIPKAWVRERRLHFWWQFTRLYFREPVSLTLGLCALPALLMAGIWRALHGWA